MRQSRNHRLAMTALALAAWLTAAHIAVGQHPSLLADPEVRWKPGQADGSYRVLVHRHAREPSHSGEGSEFLRIAGNGGSFVHFHNEVEPALVIDELSAELWVLADRPGVQLNVRAVLPRTRHPQTGRPVSVNLMGTAYTRVGDWQRLEVAKLPASLTRAARALRHQLGHDVDTREAYIDAAVLNVYGGAGTTSLYIDRLAIHGAVGPGNTTSISYATSSSSGAARAGVGELPEAVPSNRPYDAVDTCPRFHGGRLYAGNRPYVLRAIEYHDEPLRLLGGLGFNSVVLNNQPSRQLAEEARQAGVWFVCPMPERTSRAGRENDRIVAFMAGHGLTAAEHETTAKQVEQLRLADPLRRPVLIGAVSDLRNYSRIADVLIADQRPVGTSISLKDYADWLIGRRRLARPGTPVWTAIQTQLDPSVARQSRAIREWLGRTAGAAERSSGDPVSPAVSVEHLQALCSLAIVSGSRGFLFTSESSLAADDESTRRRRVALELVNLRLRLLAPWIAGGSFVTTADTSDPTTLAAVCQTERARLLLPMRVGERDQFVPKPLTSERVSFVVPGVPESNEAYLLSAGDFRQISQQRVAGGIRLELDAQDHGFAVALTADPQTVVQLRRQVELSQRRAAQLMYQMAADPLARTSDHAGEEARRQLAAADRALASGGYRQAFHHAWTSDRLASDAMHQRWQSLASRWPSVVASPLGVRAATLDDHLGFLDRLGACRVGPNRLAGGEFEALDGLVREGWRHLQHADRRLSSDVELSPLAPHGGRYSLRLRAWPNSPETVAAIETPPVWVSSATARVEAGDLVRIRGWVRVPLRIEGSSDGLMVVDSLGGPALAERFAVTKGWQEFTLFRAAETSGQVVATFALTGVGEAYLDDVAIEVVAPSHASARR